VSRAWPSWSQLLSKAYYWQERCIEGVCAEELLERTYSLENEISVESSMYKIAVLGVAVLAFAPSMHPQDWDTRRSCFDACMRESANAELLRQEVITLERETARAIQHNDGGFFRRVYSEDFSGTLSHGQAVNKPALISAVEMPDVKYEVVSASDISVNLYRDTAVATCLWSMRSLYKGQRSSSQLRVIHIYLHVTTGFRVVASQATLLPPYGQQPL
jgi:hypothetical protein